MGWGTCAPGGFLAAFDFPFVKFMGCLSRESAGLSKNMWELCSDLVSHRGQQSRAESRSRWRGEGAYTAHVGQHAQAGTVARPCGPHLET